MRIMVAQNTQQRGRTAAVHQMYFLQLVRGRALLLSTGVELEQGSGPVGQHDRIVIAAPPDDNRAVIDHASDLGAGLLQTAASGRDPHRAEIYDKPRRGRSMSRVAPGVRSGAVQLNHRRGTHEQQRNGSQRREALFRLNLARHANLPMARASELELIPAYMYHRNRHVWVQRQTLEGGNRRLLGRLQDAVCGPCS